MQGCQWKPGTDFSGSDEAEKAFLAIVREPEGFMIRKLIKIKLYFIYRSVVSTRLAPQLDYSHRVSFTGYKREMVGNLEK